ncbi:ATP-binding protein [Candidatus Daviesbacteria bacterium]|nr:ATP-binding protein [Candidatus Daviesbacteria bacterium]
MDQLPSENRFSENEANHEQPGGHIRVNVSQPELLYALAQKSRATNKNPYISKTYIDDSLISWETSELHQDDSKYINGKQTYGFSTELDLRRNIQDPVQQYYTPERTKKVLENLQRQGVIIHMDTIINGQQRLKIYHSRGAYGVEIFLGWPSREAVSEYYSDWATRVALSDAKKESVGQLDDSGKAAIQQRVQKDLTNHEVNRSVRIRLANRKRLDSFEGWDLRPPLPQNQAEFLEQTEFYRKTLEQTLKALYAEANVTPNVDITLRPPDLSGDSLDRAASLSSENVKTLDMEQVVPDRVTLHDVKGQPEAVREARRFVRAINLPELYTRRGGKPPRGALFVGPPGTGKSMIAKGIAAEAQAEFVEINAANIGSKWINESANLMNQVFDDAERKVAAGKKVIIFIDEIDAIAQQRQNAHPEDIKTISVMLQRLDGVMTKPGVVLLAATNRPDAIDPAIVRPGRIDRIIEVGLPNEEGRKEILQSYIDKTKGRAEPAYKETLFDSNIDLNTLALQTNGLSGAELANLISRVFDVKLELELEGRGWHPMTTQDLLSAVPVVKTETQKRRKLGFRKNGEE